jgi:hypothetical protein
MKLCSIGIHKWQYTKPAVTYRKYRTCEICNKHQVRDEKNVLLIPVWWTIKNK